MGDHVGQLRERNAVTRAVVRAAGNVDQDAVDDLGIVTQLGREPQRDIEQLFAFHHLGERFAADGCLHDFLDIGHVDAVARAELAVDLDFEVGLADDMEHADVFNPRHLLKILATFWPRLSKSMQIRADDLDRVGPLDAREGLFDVVADVLRKVEIDPGKLLEFLHQLFFDIFAADRLVPEPVAEEE